MCRWRRWQSVDAKVGVHVEHSGARAAWRTRVARIASSRRSTLPWLACVEACLCARPAETARDHMQMLTDEVEERTRPVVGRDNGASPGRAVLSRRVVLSPMPEKWFMRTQAGECGDDRSAAAQCRVATTRRWRSAEGRARQVALGSALLQARHNRREASQQGDNTCWLTCG